MSWLATRALAATVAVAALASGVRADGTDYFHATPDPRAVKLSTTPPRTGRQRLLIGGFALGAAAAIGVGVAFNLDSRSAADAVSARQNTGRIWSSDYQADYDRAGRSGIIAGVCYGAGGLLLIGALVAYWRTQPEAHEIDLRPGKAPTALVVPTRGGAVVGAGWSF